MEQEQSLREHLLYLLGGGGAHVDFESTIADFPADKVHQKIDGLPYTAWQVLEHMRIAQWDILEFSRNSGYVSPKWPEGYWPAKDVAPGAGAWNEGVEKFRSDLEEMKALVADPETDLFARIPHGDGQTVLREALLVADHNAYHLGVLVTMKRLLEEPAD
ncbi:MAG TPA: DinB family protein [Pyrinomonadaceae bacterium]|nr:DinB family protein [Pyrinomonadaceae bacterium]